MRLEGGDMFTDPRFADHRAPMTRAEAFRNGAIAGIIMGVIAGIGLTIFFLIMRG